MKLTFFFFFLFFRTTLEAKRQVYMTAKRKGEEIRVQIRNKHSVSLKRGKYEKHSIELEEVYIHFLIWHFLDV